MKKIFIVLLASLTLLVSACQKDTDQSGVQPGDKPLKVVVTTTFLEDMVHQLTDENIELTTIIPAGEDPHLYHSKPSDLTSIKDADLVLYHGLHFEGKMDKVLKETGIAVSKGFDESKIESMEEGEERIQDPHFWFDIGLYKQAVGVVVEELMSRLPEQKDQINDKYQAYVEKLTSLKSELQDKIGEIPKAQRILVTPHDAFQYLSKELDIEVFAPQGVSTETEVSNQDIQETVDKIIEHQIKAIFAESTTDPARMEKIRENVNAKGFDVQVVSGEGKELFSDSLAAKGQEGDQYIEMYRHNVDLIVEYLK